MADTVFCVLLHNLTKAEGSIRLFLGLNPSLSSHHTDSDSGSSQPCPSQPVPCLSLPVTSLKPAWPPFWPLLAAGPCSGCSLSGWVSQCCGNGVCPSGPSSGTTAASHTASFTSPSQGALPLSARPASHSLGSRGADRTGSARSRSRRRRPRPCTPPTEAAPPSRGPQQRSAASEEAPRRDPLAPRPSRDGPHPDSSAQWPRLAAPWSGSQRAAPLPACRARGWSTEHGDLAEMDFAHMYQVYKSRRGIKRGEDSKETYKLPHRLIEKKRRDRINECIAQLKDLLPEHLKLTTLGHLEKAVVLELTLKHVKALTSLIDQQQQQIMALQSGLQAATRYRGILHNLTKPLQFHHSFVLTSRESVTFQPSSLTASKPCGLGTPPGPTPSWRTSVPCFPRLGS
uniref:BHLH domain-containing protein n=1 Tax=Oryctolagus cuniculus TaxID=9986 RepID=G1T8W2_RABIT